MAACGCSAMALPFLVHHARKEYDDDDDFTPQMQFSAATQSSVVTAIDVLQDYRCLETPQGWILALDPASLQAFLWRPEDGERITLPPMKEDLPKNCKCLLSDKPSGAASCFVIVFDLDDEGFDFWFCPIGGSEWRRCGYELTLCNVDDDEIIASRHMAQRRGMAAVGGKVYYELHEGRELGFLDFGLDDGSTVLEPRLSFIDLVGKIVDTTDGFKIFRTSYLVESHGELFLVVVFYDGHDVHKVAQVTVHRMDFSASAWRRVEAIGDDRVFLLGGDMFGDSSFGASCAAGGGLRGNCIYFLNHLAFEEYTLHVIDLVGDGNGAITKEVLRPFRGLKDPMRPPFWMLPTEPGFRRPDTSKRPVASPSRGLLLVAVSCAFLLLVLLLSLNF